MASRKNTAADTITESEERVALIEDLGGEDEANTEERAAILAELANQEDNDIGFTEEEANGQPEPRRCLCGCDSVVGKKARFVVGHDARLKGELVRLSRAGSEGARETLAELGWSHFDTPTKAMLRREQREAAKAATAKATA